MLISKGTLVLRAVRSLSKNKTPFQQPVRNHSANWAYREPPAPAAKKYYVMAELVQGFAWWWILWHLWTEPDHITGEFPYPDSRKWTDEELGIPEELELDG